MNFYAKRRPRPVLQIISMIDILIILLIFLVVTTTFKENQSLLNVTLPKSDSLAQGSAADRRISLVVTKDEKIFLADQPIEATGLGKALTSAREASPGLKLELKVDEKVPFGTLIKVWEGLKSAGFKMNEVPARVLKGG